MKAVYKFLAAAVLVCNTTSLWAAEAGPQSPKQLETQIAKYITGGMVGDESIVIAEMRSLHAKLVNESGRVVSPSEARRQFALQCTRVNVNLVDKDGKNINAFDMDSAVSEACIGQEGSQLVVVGK